MKAYKLDYNRSIFTSDLQVDCIYNTAANYFVYLDSSYCKQNSKKLILVFHFHNARIR